MLTARLSTEKVELMKLSKGADQVVEGEPETLSSTMMRRKTLDKGIGEQVKEDQWVEDHPEEKDMTTKWLTKTAVKILESMDLLMLIELLLVNSFQRVQLRIPLIDTQTARLRSEGNMKKVTKRKTTAEVVAKEGKAANEDQWEEDPVPSIMTMRW